MNSKRRYPTIISIVIVLTLVLGGAFNVLSQSYKMTGKITNIDKIYDTIVIEVPMGTQMFTVGGPLASDAKLTKGNRPALLSDFKVGEEVTVIFHSTDQGHVIDRLIG